MRRVRFKKKHVAMLPCLMTLGNMVCGIMAISALFHGEERFWMFRDGISAAAWLVVMGMIFDMLDGKLARATSSASDFGGQLDSLSDCITFGVAPALLIIGVSTMPHKLVYVYGVLYALCTAMRLARFNVEHSATGASHDFFKGLPSPAAAGFVVSIVLLENHLDGGRLPGLYPYSRAALPFLGLIGGVLMVSRVPYPHLLKWVVKGKRQFADLVRVIFVCAAIAVSPQVAFPALFSMYLVSGLLQAVKGIRLSSASEAEPAVEGAGT